MTSSNAFNNDLDSPTDLAQAVANLRAVHVSDGDRIANLQDALADREVAYEHLKGALASSRKIGAAIGIIMAATKAFEDDAFKLLTSISQRKNRKVRAVADDIITTGTF